MYSKVIFKTIMNPGQYFKQHYILNVIHYKGISILELPGSIEFFFSYFQTYFSGDELN